MSEKFNKFLEDLFTSAKNSGARMIRLDSGDLGVLFADHQQSMKDCEKDGPQIPEEFQKSDGAVGTFQLRPKSVTAIQFLGGNWPEVLNFLWLHQIPFQSCGSLVDYSGNGGAGRHLHILGTDGVETLSEGRWVFFHGKHGEENFTVGVYNDTEFRDFFEGQGLQTSSEDPMIGNEDPKPGSWEEGWKQALPESN